MKATTIISVMVSSLFALATTIEAFDSVLDYRTGNRIHWREGYVIKALWKGQHLYVDKMDIPYVGLTLGPGPSRVVQLVPVRTADQNVKWCFRFSDSTIYWNDISDLNRISETGSSVDGGAFKFKETKERRVYKILYRYLNSDFFEVGIQVKTQNNEDKYYLATNRTRKNFPLIPEEVVNQVRFTFERP